MTTRFRMYLLSTFSLLAILLIAPSVFASGFLIYDQGADAMGKANAVTGSVTDPNAIFYNPAGLSFSKGYALFLGTNLSFLRNMNFKDADTHATTHGGDRFFLAPQVFISAQITDWMHVGIGLFVPFGGGVTWPGNWMGRDFATYTNIIGLYLNPTISFKITPELSIAAGFDVVRGTWELSKGTPDGVGLARSGWAGWGYGGNIGIMYQIVPKKVSVGLSYRSRVKVPMDGKVNFDNIPAELNNNFQDQGSHVTITMPDVVSFGVTVHPTDELEIGVDVNYIAWDTWNQIKVTFDNGFLTQIQPAKYHGSTNFRVGMQYETEIGFILRAGVAYEQSPAPRDYMTPGESDPDNIDFTIGLRAPSLVTWLVSDIGFMVQWGLPTGSETGVTGPIGKYSRIVYVLGASMTFRFGDSPEPAPEPVAPPPDAEPIH